MVKTDMFSYSESKVDPILSKLNRIVSSTLRDHVAQLEQRVGANEDNLTDVSVHINKLDMDKAYLMEKVDDLENRSRSATLRFMITFLRRLLSRGLIVLLLSDRMRDPARDQS